MDKVWCLQFTVSGSNNKKSITKYREIKLNICWIWGRIIWVFTVLLFVLFSIFEVFHNNILTRILWQRHYDIYSLIFNLKNYKAQLKIISNFLQTRHDRSHTMASPSSCLHTLERPCCWPWRIRLLWYEWRNKLNEKQIKRNQNEQEQLGKKYK